MKKLILFLLLSIALQASASVEQILNCSTINEQPTSTIMLWQVDGKIEMDLYKGSEMVLRGVSVDPQRVEISFDRGINTGYKLLTAKIDLEKSGLVTIKTTNSITTMVSNNMNLYYPEGTEVNCTIE